MIFVLFCTALYQPTTTLWLKIKQSFILNLDVNCAQHFSRGAFSVLAARSWWSLSHVKAFFTQVAGGYAEEDTYMPSTTLLKPLNVSQVTQVNTAWPFTVLCSAH